MLLNYFKLLLLTGNSSSLSEGNGCKTWGDGANGDGPAENVIIRGVFLLFHAAFAPFCTVLVLFHAAFALFCTVFALRMMDVTAVWRRGRGPSIYCNSLRPPTATPVPLPVTTRNPSPDFKLSLRRNRPNRRNQVEVGLLVCLRARGHRRVVLRWCSAWPLSSCPLHNKWPFFQQRESSFFRGNSPSFLHFQPSQAAPHKNAPGKSCCESLKRTLGKQVAVGIDTCTYM